MTKFSEQDLVEIGFSQNLARVYLALVEVGKVRAALLITKLGIHRQQVYQALDQLIERKLVRKTINQGVAVFEATDPQHLVDEFEMQKRRVQRVADVLAERMSARPLEVVVYDGVEGIIRAVGRNLLAPSGTVVKIMGASNLLMQPELARYWDVYHRTRVERGIRMHSLFDRKTDPAIIADRNRYPLTEARYLVQEEEMPAWFNLCQDTLIIVVPGGEHPQAIMIHNQATVLSLQSYFDYLWRQTSGSHHAF